MYDTHLNDFPRFNGEKSDSPRLVVTNSFFTNPTGTDRFYEEKAESVCWSNNNANEEVFAAYHAKKSN